MSSGSRIPGAKVEGVTKATDTPHTPLPINREFSFKLKRFAGFGLKLVTGLTLESIFIQKDLREM